MQVVTEACLYVLQAKVENTQHYVTERSSWLSKKLMPEKVDIEVCRRQCR
jgi:hypothetical protein